MSQSSSGEWTRRVGTSSTAVFGGTRASRRGITASTSTKLWWRTVATARAVTIAMWWSSRFSTARSVSAPRPTPFTVAAELHFCGLAKTVSVAKLCRWQTCVWSVISEISTTILQHRIQSYMWSNLIWVLFRVVWIANAVSSSILASRQVWFVSYEKHKMLRKQCQKMAEKNIKC